jgi:hypothetical protein
MVVIWISALDLYPDWKEVPEFLQDIAIIFTPIFIAFPDGKEISRQGKYKSWADTEVCYQLFESRLWDAQPFCVLWNSTAFGLLLVDKESIDEAEEITESSSQSMKISQYFVLEQFIAFQVVAESMLIQNLTQNFVSTLIIASNQNASNWPIPWSVLFTEYTRTLVWEER